MYPNLFSAAGVQTGETSACQTASSAKRAHSRLISLWVWSYIQNGALPPLDVWIGTWQTVKALDQYSQFGLTYQTVAVAGEMVTSTRVTSCAPSRTWPLFYSLMWVHMQLIGYRVCSHVVWSSLFALICAYIWSPEVGIDVLINSHLIEAVQSLIELRACQFQLPDSDKSNLLLCSRNPLSLPPECWDCRPSQHLPCFSMDAVGS